MEVVVRLIRSTSNPFKFSVPLKSCVYNITNFCGDCEDVAEAYCDMLLEEDD